MQRALKATLIASVVVMMVGGGVAYASGGGGGGSSGGGGGSMPSASGPSYDPAAEYAKAIAAMKANNFKDAARAAGHVTDAVPQNPDGWRLLGMAKAGDNDWKGSRRAYEKALKLGPDDVNTHAGLGLALHRAYRGFGLCHDTFVAFFLAKLYQAYIVFERLGETLDRCDAIFETLAFTHQLLRFQRFVPEAGVLGADIEVFKPLYGLIPVKDASSAGLSPA